MFVYISFTVIVSNTNIEQPRLGIPFEFYHKQIVDKAEMTRYAKLLDENWTPGLSDTIDLHILYSPLSTSNFTALIKSKASLETRTRLFAQVLDGLAFLHSLNVSHRDIKPGNLTVRSYDPPDAQIIDFGCATKERKTFYDKPGTIPYLAPEQKEGQYHERSVDYWASALVGLELVNIRSVPGRVTEDNYRELMNSIGKKVAHPIVSACKDMLRIEPSQRMTAAEVLEKHLSAFHSDPNRKGRKRVTDLIGESSSKEVRIT
jgi:serine/threonine protein kinase